MVTTELQLKKKQAPGGNRSGEDDDLMTYPITFDNILPLLNSPVDDKKGGYMAFCPCHSDGAKHGRRSLHVSPGKNGMALVYCFAGCNAVDILRALRGCGR
jgi:hypothetical protein